MKVKKCRDFDPNYPEVFPWGHLDSITVSNIASDIRNSIDHDLRTSHRNLVPGLRVALNIIADHAEY